MPEGHKILKLVITKRLRVIGLIVIQLKDSLWLKIIVDKELVLLQAFFVKKTNNTIQMKCLVRKRLMVILCLNAIVAFELHERITVCTMIKDKDSLGSKCALSKRSL